MFELFYLLGTLAMVLNLVRPLPIDLSIGDLFLLVALAFLCLEGLARERKLREWMPPHPLWIPAMLFVFGGLLSSFRAARPEISIAVVIKTWFVLTLWVSMGMVMVRRGRLRQVLAAFLIGVTFTSVIAVLDSFTGADLGGAISGRTANFWGRMDGTMGHPNELGFITSVAVPLFAGSLLHEWYSRRRLLPMGLCSFGLVAALWADFLSGSGAGWLSVCVSSLVIGWVWFSRTSTRGRLLLAVGLVLALVVGGRLVLAQDVRGYSSSIWLEWNLERIIATTGPGRIGLLGEAIQQISESAIVGAGMDQVGTGGLTSAELVTSVSIHNTIITSWVAGGVFAWVGLMWIYIVCLRTVLEVMRRSGKPTDWIAVALAASVLGWIVFDQTQPHLYHRYTWLTVALLFGMGYVTPLPRRLQLPTGGQPQLAWMTSPPHQLQEPLSSPH
jgi:hypothetical protein